MPSRRAQHRPLRRALSDNQNCQRAARPGRLSVGGFLCGPRR
jgi:hypothetical protein